jgi:RNA polymerase sigma-70 factor (ECF subfamily)
VDWSWGRRGVDQVSGRLVVPLRKAMTYGTGDAIAGLDTEAEALLVQDCARGDATAWRSLHLRYYPIAVAFLRKLGVTDAEVEDAAQEVFLQMHRYLGRFRGDAELKTWVYRLCVTQARRARRGRRMRDTVSKLLADAPRESLVSTPGFCEHAARRRIEAALSRLSDNHRVLFVLLDMEGVPAKQVAEILGCREVNVWRRLHDARKCFVRALDTNPREGCR